MKTEKAKVADLMLDPSNVRKHSAENLNAIKASLAKFGQQKPIVVDKKGIVIAGNGQLMAAKQLGWSTIEIVRTDLTGLEATAYAIADNRTAELAEWDETALAAQLAALEIEDEALFGACGFDKRDIEALALGPLDEEMIHELPETPITQRGELWSLGDHRLMCGDSTNEADVERLMGGQVAEMMFTDPPYGVSYEGGQIHGFVGGVGQQRKREPIIGDGDSSTYERFLPIAIRSVDGPCYCWFGLPSAATILGIAHGCGCVLSSLIVWNKTNATYGALNANYKPRHELCLYFKPKNSTLRWCGASTEATVWSMDRDGINEFHPTQKPVSLAAKALANHSARSVIDLFAGSGSTLIAAEKLKRRCFAMEMSPHYCDVIVRRWEAVTGSKAVRG